MLVWTGYGYESGGHGGRKDVPRVEGYGLARVAGDFYLCAQPS